MKVNSINSYKPSYYGNIQNNQNKSGAVKNYPQNSENILYPPPVQNEISFGGNKKSFVDVQRMRTIERNFTPEAERIYTRAKSLAKQTGSSELESRHIYLASLYALKHYITDLNTGAVTYDEASRDKLPVVVQETIYEGCTALENKKSRAKVEKVVNQHIKSATKLCMEKSKQGGKKPSPRLLSGISPSKAAIDDMVETYEIAANEESSNNFYDSYYYLLAFNSQDRGLVKEAVSFNTDLQKALMIDDSDKKKKNHLSFYDNKADSIWKNISHGNDVIYLCSSDNYDSSKHLVSSFINLINKPNQKYKNIDPENTDIILLNEYANFDFLNKLSSEIKNDKSKKGKTTVIVADLYYLILHSNSVTSEGRIESRLTGREVETLNNGRGKSNDEKGSSLRYVFSLNPESYYANTQKGALLSKVLEDYAVQTLPSLVASDAFEYLTDENGLNYIKNETGREYAPEVIKKAIELTALDEGHYPDKALNLLNGASKYFVDAKEITPQLLEKYMAEIKGLTEVSASSGTNVVYDTGKTTADIIGSPMTKKDAQSIVRQIKDRTIGTKGFVAQLEDGSSYGGGRRHTAEAIAGEAGIPMITINARDFALKDIDALSQNADLSEMKIRQIVSSAKAQAEANENKTAMIFIENFDNFASNPLYGVSSIYEQKAFSQLLDEMESARKNDNVNLIVVGSANMPGLIDPNIMKPYKFLDSIIIYPPQDSKQRKDVLEYYINKMNLEIAGDSKEEKEKTVGDIAETTQGFTVADLMYLLNVAKSVSVERDKDKIDGSDFTEAYLQATTGRSSEVTISPARKRIVTSHEAGHALTLQVMYEIAQKSDIPWHLPDKVNFLTLDPRGNFGGAMFHKNSGNEEYSYEKIMSDLVCSYGGHSAENKIYNMSGSWGITADMEQVSALARAAVMDMGMGPETGVVHIKRNALGSPDVSEKKLQAIENDVDSFVGAAKEISDLIVGTYKDFIIEFTDKYAQRVGTGECIISSEEFIENLNSWREKQPEAKKSELSEIEGKITAIMDRTKAGK